MNNSTDRVPDAGICVKIKYFKEGKLSLTVAIGCTGGHHRSVAIASALTDYLVADGIRAVNVNRDLDK